MKKKVGAQISLSFSFPFINLKYTVFHLIKQFEAIQSNFILFYSIFILSYSTISNSKVSSSWVMTCFFFR